MASKKKKSQYRSAAEVLSDMPPLTLSVAMLTYRQCEDMTQADMGKHLGISAQNVCDIEKRRTLVSVARALTWADKLALHPAMAAGYALQDQIDHAKLPYVVRVTVRQPAKRQRKPSKG